MATQPLKDHGNSAPAPDRYLLEDILGHGGMGAVYRVRDRETGELLALKRLLLPPAAEVPDDEKRKLRWARGPPRWTGRTSF